MKRSLCQFFWSAIPIFLLMILFSIDAKAATLQSGYLTFSENADGTLTVTDYDKGKNREHLHRLDIESSYIIDGKPYTVSKIGDYVFQGEHFYSVYIADGIDIGNYSFADVVVENYVSSMERGATFYIGSNYIGKHAFENATFYSVVTMPYVSYFDDYCFKNVYFSDQIGPTLDEAYIGESAFEGSNVTGVFFNIRSISTIKKNAFKNSDLSYLSLSSNTKIIEEGAFPNNEHMVIEIDYSVTDLTVFDFDFTTLTNACFYIRDKSPLKSYLYNNYLTYYVIDLDQYVYGRLKPGTIVSDMIYTYLITGDYTSTLIGVTNDADTISLDHVNGYAHHDYFYTITGIGANAFKNAPSLTTITLGNAIKVIENKAFNGCENLSYVELPTSITTIEKNAFPNLKNLRIVIPRQVTNISGFDIDNMTKVVFVINKKSKLANKLSKLHVNYQIGKDGKIVYAKPKKGSTITYKKAKYKVTGTSTVTFIKPSSKTITKLSIPSTVSYNGHKLKVTKVNAKACYKYAKLTTVTIGDNVTQIGDNAFARCSKLKSITFGKKVKKLGKKVLYYDKKLSTIKFKGTKLQSIGKQTFRKVPKKVSILVPTSKVKKYSQLIKKAK